MSQKKPAPRLVTVGDVIGYYNVNHIEEGVVDKVRQRKALSHIAAIIGAGRLIEELASEDFVAYRQKRRRAAGKKKGSKTSEATIRRELATFTAAANFAVKNRKLENRHIPIIDLPDPSPSKDRWLTREEAAKLRTEAQGKLRRLSRTYRFVCIALATAKRRRVIETLKWDRVDFANRIIDFRTPGEIESKKRKGRSPISDWLYPIMQQMFREKITDFVLDNPSPLIRDFKKAAKRAGMEDVTPHTLRHTWGTWAAQAGASMWDIAGVMGCSIATATKNYLHHSPEHLRAVADKVSPEIGAV